MATWIVEKTYNSNRVYEKGCRNEADRLLYIIDESSNFFSDSVVTWTDNNGTVVLRLVYPSLWNTIKGHGAMRIESGGNIYARIISETEYQSMPALVLNDGSKYRIVTSSDVLFSPDDYPTDLWKSGKFIGARIMLSKSDTLYRFEFTTQEETDMLNFVLLDYLICRPVFPNSIG